MDHSASSGTTAMVVGGGSPESKRAARGGGQAPESHCLVGGFGSGVRITARESFHLTEARTLCRLFDPEVNGERLLFQTHAGDIQRNVDVEHLSDLKQYQHDHLERHGHYSFSGQLVVAEQGGRYALVDGQHRLEALKYLLDVDPDHARDISVPVLVVHIRSVDEYDEVFVAVNKNKPVRLYRNVHSWKTVLKLLESYFLQHFRPYLRSTENPLVPHLNLDKLLRYFDEGDLVRRMGLGFEELKNEIESLNTCYRLHWRELIEAPRYLPNVASWASKCERKAPERPLYLGMYRKFEWVDRILLRVTNAARFPNYLTMVHVPVGYRGRISTSLRRNVWKKRNHLSIEGPCYVCSKPIEYSDFECGHVVSVFAGGPTTLDNLEPVCKMCNSDMGVDNLNDFRERLLAEGGGWQQPPQVPQVPPRDDDEARGASNREAMQTN